MSSTAPHLPRIFVSHSHKDNEFGLRLVADLRAALGGDEAAIWYDASGGLSGGAAWWRRIRTELSARDTFVVILSPDALASPWVNDEIDLAWKQKNAPGGGKRIVPVLYRPCRVREDLALLESTTVSFLPPVAYEVAFAYLLDVLGIDPQSIPVREALPPAASAAASPPLVPPDATQPAAAPAVPISRRAVVAGALAAGAMTTLAGAGVVAAQLAAHGRSTQAPQLNRTTPSAVATDVRLRWRIAATNVGQYYRTPPMLAGTTVCAIASMPPTAEDAIDARTRVVGFDTSGRLTLSYSAPDGISGNVAILGATASVLALGFGETYRPSGGSAPGQVIGVRVSDGAVAWRDNSTPNFDDLSVSAWATDGNIACAYASPNDGGDSGVRVWLLASGAVRSLPGDFTVSDTPYTLAEPDMIRNNVTIGQGVIAANGLIRTFQASGQDTLAYGLIAVDAGTLRLKWAVPLSTASLDYRLSAPPTIAGDAVYGVATDLSLYAVSLASGKVRWRVSAGYTQQYTPAAANGRVYLAVDQRIDVFDATSGKQVWTTQLPFGDSALSSPSAVPVIRDGTLYLMGGSGKLYAFSAADGTPLWSYQCDESAFTSTIAVASDTIYVATQRYLYAIKTQV